MYNGLIIEDLLSSRRIPKKTLLEFLGKRVEGGGTALKQIMTGNPTVKRLEPIADFFQISMDSFFIRSIPFTSLVKPIGTDLMENEYKRKNEFLEQLLKEKEKRIETLETLVQVLQNRK